MLMLLPPQRFTKLNSSFPHLNPLATFPAPDKCTGRSQAQVDAAWHARHWRNLVCHLRIKMVRTRDLSDAKSNTEKTRLERTVKLIRPSASSEVAVYGSRKPSPLKIQISQEG